MSLLSSAVPRACRTLLVGLVFATSGVSAAAERRVALVIGNGAYHHASKLANPASDARAVRAALQRLGFEIFGRDDLDRAGMERELRAFRRAAYGTSVAMVFYAGHALQVGGQNYLLPVSASIETEQDLAYEAIAAELFLNETSGAALRIVILDACRDNPFKAKLAAAVGARSTTVGRGLRPIDAPSATLIAYATRADDIAADGIGTNSPFTTALLKHIETPGLEVRFLFGRVSDDVRRSTGGKQDPAIYASLGGAQYFLRSPLAPPPAPAAPAADAEIVFWETIKSSSNPADYRAYLEQYPTGRFAPLARVRATPPLPDPAASASPAPPPNRPGASSPAQSPAAALPDRPPSPALAPPVAADPPSQAAKVAPEANSPGPDPAVPATWVGSTICGGYIRLTTQNGVLSGEMRGRRAVPLGQLAHINQGAYIVHFDGDVDPMGIVKGSGGAPDGRRVSVSGKLPDVIIGGSFYCDGTLRLTRE